MARCSRIPFLLSNAGTVLSHSPWKAFPDKIVPVEVMEDIGDVLELSSSLLEVHCRAFGLRDFRALVFQYCHGNGRRDFQAFPLAAHTHSCSQLQLLG